jgi:hypothetical protein
VFVDSNLRHECRLIGTVSFKIRTVLGTRTAAYNQNGGAGKDMILLVFLT